MTVHSERYSSVVVGSVGTRIYGHDLPTQQGVQLPEVATGRYLFYYHFIYYLFIRRKTDLTGVTRAIS